MAGSDAERVLHRRPGGVPGAQDGGQVGTAEQAGDVADDALIRVSDPGPGTRPGGEYR